MPSCSTMANQTLGQYLGSTETGFAVVFSAIGNNFSNNSVISTTLSPRATPSITVRNFKSLIDFLDLYFVPLVIFTGLIGNGICFVVFICSHLRRLSSSVYLAALSLSDSGFLLCVFLSWGTNIKFEIIHTNGWCQVFVYLSYVCSFLSVWYIVCFTVERYIAVCFPFSRQEMCTPRRAKIVVVSLAIFAGGAYSFAIWTSGITFMYGRNYCSPLKPFFHFVTVVNNVDTVFTLMVPILVITVINIRIVFAVAFISRNRQGMQAHRVGRHSSSSSLTQLTVKLSNSHAIFKYESRTKKDNFPNRSQVKVTKMLVIVSSTFLLLNLPSHAIKVHYFFMSFANKSFFPSREYLLTQKFFQYVYYINFAINLFLYSVCGRNFRRALNHVAKRLKYNASKCFRLECTCVRATRATVKLRTKTSSSSRSVRSFV